ncbi:MAG: signal peptidase II [Erysipelotrichaceae bacterium]|nr:signal peptidase II [Erysipelotrichaceae bacterium]
MINILYALSVVILTIIDQYSKKAIVSSIELNEKIRIIPGFFSLTYVRNFGAGFSILQNATVFLIVLSAAAIIVLSYMLIKTRKNDLLSIISYLLIIAGALGNLIDRVRLGYVVDFLDFLIFGYDFPVFNIADSYITVGCFLLILQLLMENRNAKNRSES